MKQGQADNKGPGGRKVEPTSRAVNPGAVSYLGNHLGNHASDSSGDMTLRATPWDGGRGYMAPSGAKPYAEGPGGGRTIHTRGTQGKH